VTLVLLIIFMAVWGIYGDEIKDFFNENGKGVMSAGLKHGLRR